MNIALAARLHAINLNAALVHYRKTVEHKNYVCDKYVDYFKSCVSQSFNFKLVIREF